MREELLLWRIEKACLQVVARANRPESVPLSVMSGVGDFVLANKDNNSYNSKQVTFLYRRLVHRADCCKEKRRKR